MVGIQLGSKRYQSHQYSDPSSCGNVTTLNLILNYDMYRLGTKPFVVRFWHYHPSLEASCHCFSKRIDCHHTLISYPEAGCMDADAPFLNDMVVAVVQSAV